MLCLIVMNHLEWKQLDKNNKSELNMSSQPVDLGWIEKNPFFVSG